MKSKASILAKRREAIKAREWTVWKKLLVQHAEKYNLTEFRSADWLAHQRPSVAIVQCLGSGPWKYPRRATVQAHALAVLGRRDILKLSDEDIVEMLPLDWQRTMLTTLRDNLVACNRRFDRLGRFDTCFRADIEILFGMPELPKVLAMYVRDYLCQAAFPVDRHVREWLKLRNLPTKESDILHLCAQTSIDPNSLNRAIFGSKSENPKFPAQ